MIQNRNERNQFHPVPYANPLDRIATPTSSTGNAAPESIRGQSWQPWQQENSMQSVQPVQPMQPEQESARASRLPIETIDTRSLWAAHPQEMPQAPFPSFQSPPASPLEQPGTSRRRVKRPAQHKKLNGKKRLVLLAALSLVLVCSLISLAAWRVAASSTPNVTLYRVGMKNVDLPIGGGGIAYPIQRLDIAYPFNAHVLSVFVKPGDKVTPNQSLVQIDLSEVNGQNLAQLDAQVQQAYQDMLASQSYLYSVLNTNNPVIVAQAQQNYTTAKNKYEFLQAEATSPSLHQGKILSAISGTVVAVSVYPGQVFSANKVMLTIFDESSIIIRVKIPLMEYGQIRINQPAVVSPSALPNLNFSGTVISIIQNADPQTGTFEVWVNVPNGVGELLPGMSAFAQVQISQRTLVVPRLAVLNPDRDSVVFVVNQGIAHIRHVQILGYVGDEVLIGSGLSVNDMIVLVGIDMLQDNQQVHVTKTEN